MAEVPKTARPLRILAGSANCPLAGQGTGQPATIIERVHDGLAISGLLRLT